MFRFTEALEMHDLAFAQIADGVDHIRVVCQAQDIVIRCPRLLLGCHVLGQIRKGISLGLEIGSSERNPASRLRVNGTGVIHEILVKAVLPEICLRHSAGELVNDRGDHFHVCQFFCTAMLDIRIAGRSSA